MKVPYQVSRTLKRYESKAGRQVCIRVRSKLFSDIEVPVYEYIEGKRVNVNVKTEHWKKGHVTGGKYHMSLRNLNLLLDEVEYAVKDSVFILLEQKIKPTYDDILKLTYFIKEKAIIDAENERNGKLLYREDGGAFESKDDFLEFVGRQDDPKFDELKKQAGLLVKQYILDYWDEYMNEFAPDEYRVVKPSIQKYIEKTGDNCKVKEYDGRWLERYFTDLVENGFLTTKNGKEKKHYYEVSTIEKYYKILRNFGKWLFEEKQLIDTEDYKRFKLRNPKSKKASLIKIKSNPFKNTHALLKSEFDHLFFYQFENKGDELIRDIFILQTWFGGLRMSDFFDLTEDNISIQGNEVQVQFEQQKTDTKVVNMANRNYVNPIILKYGSKLPEFPSPNKYNLRLKKVFNKAGLDRKLPFRSEPANEKKATTEYFPMWEKVSNRWARNCAVSILVEMGYNDHYIKKFTGHTDEKMLRHYRDVHKSQVKDMLDEVKPEQP